MLHPGRTEVFDPVRTPYEIDPADFPRAGLLEEQFVFLLRYAILAPSTHNTQPWRFAVSENGVDVFVDYSRRLPVADPSNREVLMSVGAAIFNLRVASAHFGIGCVVEYDLSRTSDRPVATVFLSPESSIGVREEGYAGLLKYIAVRRTNRHPFLVARVPASAVRVLESVAAGHLASLAVSTDGTLNEKVAALVADAERRQYADRSFRKEVAEWIHPNDAQRADGMTGASAGVEGIPSALASWATSTLDLGRLRAAQDRNLCIDAPGLVVVTSEDSVRHWLDAGEVLQHFLLTATREGLQTSYFNMPVQVPELRVELKRLLGSATWPQLLLRIGNCLIPSEPTPRRPLEETLIRR